MSQGFGRHEAGRIAKEGKAESPCKAGVAEMACQGPLWNVPETFRMPTCFPFSACAIPCYWRTWLQDFFNLTFEDRNITVCERNASFAYETFVEKYQAYCAE